MLFVWSFRWQNGDACLLRLYAGTARALRLHIDICRCVRQRVGKHIVLPQVMWNDVQFAHVSAGECRALASPGRKWQCQLASANVWCLVGRKVDPAGTSAQGNLVYWHVACEGGHLYERLNASRLLRWWWWCWLLFFWFVKAISWSCLFVLQEEELYACQRGCRLFSICQFVRDGDDLNQTKSECESSEPLVVFNFAS